MSFYHHTATGLIIAIKAHPGAKHTQIGPIIPAAPTPGWPNARLKISTNAPPEDGRANTAIITALAQWLKTKPANITLIAGATSRDKKLRVLGVRGVPDV